MKTKITQDSKVTRPSNSDQQGLIETYWSEGRRLYNATKFPKGTRDISLKYVAHYLFFGDKSRRIPPAGYGLEKQRSERLLRWYRRAFPDYRYHVNHVRRCVEWGSERARKQSDWYVTFQMENDRRSRTVKRRLFEEAQAIREEGLTVTQTLLARRTGIHSTTVKRHKHIWEHPYQPSAYVLTREESEKRSRRHLRVVPVALLQKKVSPASVVEALADAALPKRKGKPRKPKLLEGRCWKMLEQGYEEFAEFKKENRRITVWSGGSLL